MPTGPSGTVPRILALVAAPLVNEDGNVIRRLGLEAEKEQIIARLGEVKRQAEMHIEVATPENLSRLLTLHNYGILHFTGHGGLGLLCFEDGRGGLYDLTPDKFQALIAPEGRAPFRLAFLSACHSESMAQALVNVGVPHVVVIYCETPVDDRAAITFARNFYPALLAGETVQAAFDRAQATVWASGDMPPDQAEWEAWKFRLLGQGNHNRQLFSPPPPEGQLQVVLPPRPERIGVRPHTFTGRERELYHLIGLILGQDPRYPNRLVTMTGAGGIGKSELAKEAGRWFAERRLFPGGVVFVALSAYKEAVYVRATIAEAAGVRLEGMRQEADFARALAQPKRLFILDDLDEAVLHDRQGVRKLLQSLLDYAAPSQFLVTTRQSPGGLAEQMDTLHALRPAEAEALFRTWAILKGANLWGWDALPEQETLAAILKSLGGYPLAIYLTAQHLGQISLATLWQWLQAAEEEVLADPDVPADQHNSVTYSVRLSLDRLRQQHSQAADFFPLLSLFPAGISEEGLRRIFGARQVLLAKQVCKVSLAEYEPSLHRYELLPPIQRYAERQRPAEARDIYGPAALRHYRALAEELDAHITSGRIEMAMTFFALERPNFLFWLEWGAGQEPGTEEGVCQTARLVGALENCQVLGDPRRERLPILERTLAVARRLKDQWGQARVLKAIGDVQSFQDQREAALQSYQQALGLFRQVGDRLGEANVL
ncbi:MAG: CHAT domain-containing protein, partial [Acidobacteria bacterium]|nr:CHAT domain-containing protein [Acidobacteriota bacterium]